MTRTTRRTAPPFSVVEFKAITDGNVASLMKWLDDGGQMDELVVLHDEEDHQNFGRWSPLLCASTLGQADCRPLSVVQAQKTSWPSSPSETTSLHPAETFVFNEFRRTRVFEHG